MRGHREPSRSEREGADQDRRSAALRAHGGPLCAVDESAGVQGPRPQRPRCWADAPRGSQNPDAAVRNPLPGPTIRARVGGLVELTFLNLIEPLNFPRADLGK